MLTATILPTERYVYIRSLSLAVPVPTFAALEIASAADHPAKGENVFITTIVPRTISVIIATTVRSSRFGHRALTVGVLPENSYAALGG